MACRIVGMGSVLGIPVLSTGLLYLGAVFELGVAYPAFALQPSRRLQECDA